MKDVNLDEEFGPELPEEVSVVNFPEQEKLGGILSDIKNEISKKELSVDLSGVLNKLDKVINALNKEEETVIKLSIE